MGTMHSSIRPLSGTSVLLIEDNTATRETTALLLRSAGFYVSAVATGSAGLAAARSTAFAVAIIDVGLPDMSGIDVIRRLSADGNPCLTVLTRAFPDDDRRTQALSAGASWFVEGLVLADELEAILCRACTRAPLPALTNGQTPSNEGQLDALQPPLKDQRIAKSVCTTANGEAEASLRAMAAGVGLSESRFRHVFVKCTSIPVSEFLFNLRLLRAARSLIRTDRMVIDIVKETGLSDSRYFRFLFRRRFGMPPVSYRRLFKGPFGTDTAPPLA
jgi:DNA-binding response OmpR family regulator